MRALRCGHPARAVRKPLIVPLSEVPARLTTRERATRAVARQGGEFLPILGVFSPSYN